MLSNRLKAVFVVGLVVSCLSVQAGAQIILANPGFDQTALNDGAWGGVPAGWQGTGANEQDLSTASLTPSSQSGENVCAMNNGTSIQQGLQQGGGSIQVEANKTYKISVWVGRRTGNEGSLGGILEVFLMDSATQSRIARAIYDMDGPPAQPSNSWIYQTFYLSTGSDPNGAGSQLNVGFANISTRTGAGGQFWFAQVILDDVSVEAIAPVSINPGPTNGGSVYDTGAVLTWEPGPFAQEHDIYFSDNWADVNSADSGSPKGPDQVYKARQNGNSYEVSGLTPGQIYYWRIDDIDGATVYHGEIWSFTVIGPTAFNPSPADEALFVDPDVLLSWFPGTSAEHHELYLGTNREDVLAGTNDTSRGVIDVNYYIPNTLEFDRTYYWKVDEDDGTTLHAGNVWSFTTTPEIIIVDPNLMGWWALDETEGTGALDQSGQGNHATLLGSAARVPGQLDGALSFDGTSYVDCGNPPSLNMTEHITVSAWVNTADADNGEDNPFVAKGETSYALGNLGGTLAFSITDDALYSATFPVDGTFNGEWHHLAGTYDGSTVSLYVDGEVQATTDHEGGIATNDFNLAFGTDTEQTWTWYNGMLDDVHIYNRALTQVEINQVMTGDPNVARNPHPYNGEVLDIEHVQSLTWVAGENAVEHDVYLGTDRTAVSEATTETAGIYQGRQAGTEFASNGLDWDTTYYWRVDEIQGDGTVTPGSIWAFTIVDYIVVDDFEAYTDERPNRIFVTWRDRYSYTDAQGNVVGQGNGTGMTVGVDEAPFGPERTIVNSGTQSLPLTYDNTASPYYSETDRTFASAQNWQMRQGRTLSTLSLQIQGRWQSPGQFSADGDIYTVVGSGNDIWNMADQFHYVYLPLNGDGSITAKVESLDNTDPWAKAGVMMRNGLAADAANLAALVAPSGRVTFQQRDFAGNATTSQETGAGSIALPYWVRLTRVGSIVTGEMSADGQTWQTIEGNSSVAVSWFGDVYVGLAVTSHVDAGTACEAVLSNVTVTGAAASVFSTSMDIGLPVNDPGDLYVALEDAGGLRVEIGHDDNPNAILVSDWVEWSIPLSAFSDEGLDISQIKKMVIGIGDKTPDGKGKLYVDDIRLYPEE